MLILFDIDATLITTSRTGIWAMGEAGRELLGPHFDESVVEYAGRLDPLIIGELLTAHGQAPTPAARETFRQAYKRHLEAKVHLPGLAKACPGVPELLDALAVRADVTLGLLTGNFPETGAIKLRASGVDPERFSIAAWGNDSPHDPPARDHLPPVAMGRFRAKYGRAIEPERVTIIGDTPHDIRCAHAHGCRALGVATGQFTVEKLVRAGADHAVDDLSDTDEVLAWLTMQR
jgi:phosphoglycolate phosphatase